MSVSIEGLEHLETDYDLAEYLQNTLVARATAGEANNEHYQELRRYFLENPATKGYVPRWVRTNPNLSQFWQFIKSKFGTYAERRQFIWGEFRPLLEYLETVQRLPLEKSIEENALTILRVMYELGVTLGNSKTGNELLELTHLDESAFDQADTFLLGEKYVEGSNGLDGDRWLTSSGIQYLRLAMRERLPLSLDEERVLRFIVNSTPKSEAVERSKIEATLNLDSEKYEAACEKLVDFNLINYWYIDKGGIYGMIRATQLGRQAVHDNFRTLLTPSIPATLYQESTRVTHNQPDSLDKEYRNEQIGGIKRQLIDQTKNLNRLLEEASTYGTRTSAPLKLQNDIEKLETHIAELKEELTELEADS